MAPTYITYYDLCEWVSDTADHYWRHLPASSRKDVMQKVHAILHKKGLVQVADDDPKCRVYHPDVVRLRSFIRRVTWTAGLNYLRDQRRQMCLDRAYINDQAPLEDLRPEWEREEDEYEAEQIKKDLSSSLDRLDRESRLIIESFYLTPPAGAERVTDEKVGASLGIPRSTVQRKRLQALSTLGSLLRPPREPERLQDRCRSAL